MVIDKGMGVEATRDLFRLAADSIDFLKLGFGTALLYPESALEEKIRLAREWGVEIYPGGTLFELAWWQGKGREFIRRVADLGFTAVEISEGTVDLPERERLRFIEEAAARGLRVLTELGKKDPALALDATRLPRRAERDLSAGAEFVIVEGRDSGIGVGVYDGVGLLRTAMRDAILEGMAQPERLIWEAPQVKQQQAWLLCLGPNVNLGNVQPPDVVSLEAMRQALRGDTLRQFVAAGEGGAMQTAPHS